MTAVRSAETYQSIPPPLSHGCRAVAVIDKHEAIHAAVQSWCAQARPRIPFSCGYFSVERFIAEHPENASFPVGIVIVDVQTYSGKADFTSVDNLVELGYRVIVYTHTETDEVVTAGVDHGAVTCLVKSEGKEHLINAIRTADTESPYIGPRLARAMLNDKTLRRPALAPREKEILLAWFRTDSKDEAARLLSIAPSTVRTTVQRIRAKYTAIGRPATTKVALAARAIQDGIISIDEL
jgi:DNA-binding NarL/FixJ family response regulator